jgi:hypothetical protein
MTELISCLVLGYLWFGSCSTCILAWMYWPSVLLLYNEWMNEWMREWRVRLCLLAAVILSLCKYQCLFCWPWFCSCSRVTRRNERQGWPSSSTSCVIGKFFVPIYDFLVSLVLLVIYYLYMLITSLESLVLSFVSTSFFQVVLWLLLCSKVMSLIQAGSF